MGETDMNELSMMQQALGAQWEQLPPALRAHYQTNANTDIGVLDVEYPRLMQLYLNIMRVLGALVNRRGKALPTTVDKHMDGNIQRWQRSLRFPDGNVILFNSHWVYAGNSELIEYVNPFLGLRMAVHVANGKLYYEGRHVELRLGKLRVPIPEWLVLGHTTIVETALDADHFAMDFRLVHPLLGQVYRYAGKFKTVLPDQTHSGIGSESAVEGSI
jgi:hypothetical protein